MPETLADFLDRIAIMHFMTIQLDDESGCCEVHHRIWYDGKPTQVLRLERMGGPPGYPITADIFRLGEESFDNLEAKGSGLFSWLIPRIQAGIQEGGPST